MSEEWVVLTYAKTQAEAHIIKGKLESEGIPVIIQQEAIGKIYRLTVDGLGEIRILIPGKFKKLALSILYPDT